MNTTTVKVLLDLNLQFYQTFAVQFSATRQRLQPGVWKIIEGLPQEANVVDIGCGNGELWRELVRRGFRGLYVGLDFSRKLLAEAASREVEGTSARSLLWEPETGPVHPAAFPGDGARAVFIPAALSDPSWDALPKSLPFSPSGFDVVLAFAVLHHLPGHELHRRTVCKVNALLKPGGRFIHSEWQFLNSPRLRARIQPWETTGLSAGDVEPGDYLLDWRSGGSGLRYVHHFSETELAGLAAECGFKISETFYSDGEGGRLGLYQTWEPEKRTPGRESINRR